MLPHRLLIRPRESHELRVDSAVRAEPLQAAAALRMHGARTQRRALPSAISYISVVGDRTFP